MREVFYSLKGHIFRKYGRCGITNLKVEQQFCLSGTLLLASTMEIIDKRFGASNQNYKLKNNVFSAKYGCNLVQRPMNPDVGVRCNSCANSTFLQFDQINYNYKT